MYNKRELNIIKKANEELKKVQANCSARLLNKSDIEDTLQVAKKAFNSLGPIERKYLIKLTAINEYSIPVSYKWSAKTSQIVVNLNKYGTITSIDVYRDSAPIEAYGGSSSIKVRCEYE